MPEPMVKPMAKGEQRPKSESITALRKPSSGNLLRSLCWDANRGWHIPFTLKLGLAISIIAVMGAAVLAYLEVIQYQQLLERQSDAFGEAIVEQLAGSLVEPVFTDDQLAIQLKLKQLAKKSAVYGVALYLPSNAQLLANIERAQRILDKVKTLKQGGSNKNR